ncbi:MAG TPA: hypothetical protein VN643_06810 [Pyrinomonadaceae bacterium]|nr:hypothetical protein [Pyrinomonadaceae bacterium]
MKTNNRVVTLIFLLLVLCSWPVHGQGRRAQTKSLGYIFVSPNNRENLTLEDAKAGLNSEEEKRLIQEERDVTCRLQKKVIIEKAIGSWSDGAEHSTVLRGQMNEASLRYAGSWLGKFATQKAILYFHQTPRGAGRVYALYLRPNLRDLSTIANKLEAGGLANRTIVSRSRRVTVFIVDLKNELKAKVTIAARRLKARVTTAPGQAEFIGDDDRSKAQEVFAQEISKYEASHPNVKRACRVKTRFKQV